MIRQRLIGLVCAVSLLGATACGDEDVVKETDDGNATAPDGGADGEPSDGEPGDGMPGDGSLGDGSSTDGDPSDGTPDGSDGNPSDGSGDGDGEGDGDDAGTGEPDGGMDAGGDGDGDGDGSDEPDAGSGDGSDDAGTEPELPAFAAHYKFDENTGTTSADAVGAFGEATLTGGASFSPGVSGSALELAGGATQQYAALPPTILEGCNDITIAMWMKLGSTPPWTRLFDVDGLTDGFLFFTPTQDAGGAPHLFFNIFYPPGAGADDQGVSAAYPAGTVLVDQWHHVAFTLTGGVGKLYFDGVEIGSNPMASKPSDLTIAPAGSHAWIGRSTFPDPYLDGTIDDFVVSCTAFTAEQVGALAD